MPSKATQIFLEKVFKLKMQYLWSSKYCISLFLIAVLPVTSHFHHKNKHAWCEGNNTGAFIRDRSVSLIEESPKYGYKETFMAKVETVNLWTLWLRWEQMERF